MAIKSFSVIYTYYLYIYRILTDNDDVWINTEPEQRDKYEEWDAEAIVSTYKDNPFIRPDGKKRLRD